jgi:hypothetical protein
VLNLLEVAGIVEHAKSVSQYRLLLDRNSIVEKAMKKRKEKCLESSIEIIDTLLSRYCPQFLATLRAERFDKFTQLAKDAE